MYDLAFIESRIAEAERTYEQLKSKGLLDNRESLSIYNFIQWWQWNHARENYKNLLAIVETAQF